MKFLYIFIGILFLVCAVCAETPINEGASVYPTETTLVVTPIPATPVVTDTPLVVVSKPTPTPAKEKPIAEESFKYNSSSKSEIKEKPLVTINITPFLSSGKKLDRKIDEKELPQDQMVTNLVEHLNGGVKKTKVVQIYPETTLEMSDDAEIVKQSSTNGGKMKHEIYYGYQNVTENVPWKKYYKAENCGAEFCKVVRADFNTRVVTVTNVPLIEINKIVGIVAYEALP